MSERLALKDDKTTTGGSILGPRQEAPRATPDTYYTARMPSGEFRHGVTDSRGRTERHETDAARSIEIYLGHRQEA